MDTTPPILLIDKPTGMTSFDCIRVLRRALNVRKMGHAGTLDPLASGLMIIGIGSGTKELTEYIKLPKEYVAEVLLGERRSTGDMEGVILEERDVPTQKKEDVLNAVESMKGTLRLPVSAYSAVKRGGVPLYKRARMSAARGEVLKEEELPVRDMVVTNAALEGIKEEGTRTILTIRFSVGSGTYIRSLGEELGRRLGYPATLRSLRRTKVGEFSVDEARKLTSYEN